MGEKLLPEFTASHFKPHDRENDYMLSVSNTNFTKSSQCMQNNITHAMSKF